MQLHQFSLNFLANSWHSVLGAHAHQTGELLCPALLESGPRSPVLCFSLGGFRVAFRLGCSIGLLINCLGYVQTLPLYNLWGRNGLPMWLICKRSPPTNCPRDNYLSSVYKNHMSIIAQFAICEELIFYKSRKLVLLSYKYGNVLIIISSAGDR